MNRVLTRYDRDIDGGACPDCGDKMLKKASCKSCKNCGHSICNMAITKIIKYEGE
jgi:DNA-directed RNA polymerase subunit RPC12/RpoP